MNILITGSEGVIGRRLRDWLMKEPLPPHGGVTGVYTCDRLPSESPTHTIVDITHPETLRRAFQATHRHDNEFSSGPDLVFHLAAAVGRRASEAWATVALRTNVEGTQNVVDLCLEYGARLLYVSTSEVYGLAFESEVPVKEPYSLGLEAQGPHQGIYGLSKYMGELIVEMAMMQRGLDTVIARPFMCYSEDEPLSPYRSAIARFMRAILRGEPITVHEGAVRSWCYVDDMVEGLARLGLSDCQGVYNVGRHEPYMLLEVASALGVLVAECRGGGAENHPEIVEKPMPPGIYPVKHASFDKIKRDIGWGATTTLEEGLRRVVEHHLKKTDTVPIL